ncbi:MAG: hypothetical protein R2778_09425 [Saprospiraceae bacterium]
MGNGSIVALVFKTPTGSLQSAQDQLFVLISRFSLVTPLARIFSSDLPVLSHSFQ